MIWVISMVFIVILAVSILHEPFFALNAVSAIIIIVAVLSYSIFGEKNRDLECKHKNT